jgi:hypothetical protein
MVQIVEQFYKKVLKVETLHEEAENEDKEESPCLLTKDLVILLLLLLRKKNLPFNASQQSASSSYPYSFSCAARKNLPHNSVQQNKRKRRGRKKKQGHKKILNRNRTHHDLL